MYSVFIAYHGSNSELGSGAVAQELRELLSRENYRYRPYCGPETDEHNFLEHMNVVIPQSELFVLVINDNVPRKENGALDIDRSYYLSEEIKSFRKLIKNKKRNVKDFCVCFLSNKIKNEAKYGFVKSLLSEIDEDDTLYNGNHDYIHSFSQIVDWFRSRTNSKLYNQPFSINYVPIPLLEEEVKSLAQKNNSSKALLIEMKKGMGKTTFIKHIRDDLFPNSSAALFFNKDEGYLSVGKFKKDFIPQLIKKNEETFYLDDFGYFSINSFAKYLNKIKEEYYKNETLVILLDSIDDARLVNGVNPILELFTDMSLYDDGIIFVITSKLPEGNLKYNRYISNFIDNFKGKRITVDENNIEYLRFLYLYYSGRFYESFIDTDLEVDELFENVKPKNILTFSLMFYIANLYLEENKNKSLEIVKSVENALTYYYEYLKEHSEASEDYERSMAALYLLAISNKPLTYDELDKISLKVFNFLVSPSIVKYKDTLAILVESSYDVTGKIRFNIKHEKLKEMIILDNANKKLKSDIKGSIEFTFMALNSQKKLLDFINENIEISYLFNFYYDLLNDEKRSKLIKNIANSLSNLSWGDKMNLINKEQYFLEKVVSIPEFKNFDEISRAKILTRIGIDEQLMEYNFDSIHHLEEGYWIFRNHEAELTDLEKYSYLDNVASFANMAVRLDSNYSTIGLFKKSYRLSKELFEKGIVPLRDHTNTILAYGNVADNFGQNSKLDFKMINEAKEILFNSKEDIDLGQRGWYYQRLSNYSYCVKEFDKVHPYLLKSFDAYLYAFEKAPESFYFGNLVQVSGAVIRSISEENISVEEKEAKIKEIENKIMTNVKKINFNSVGVFAYFYDSIGMFYEAKGNKEVAREYYEKGLNGIEALKQKRVVLTDELNKARNLLLKKISFLENEKIDDNNHEISQITPEDKYPKLKYKMLDEVIFKDDENNLIKGEIVTIDRYGKEPFYEYDIESGNMLYKHVNYQSIVDYDES